MLEEIFDPSNRDEDCRRISRMLMPVENAVEQYLWDGEYGESVELFLQMAYEDYGVPGIGKWLAEMKAVYAGEVAKR